LSCRQESRILKRIHKTELIVKRRLQEVNAPNGSKEELLNLLTDIHRQLQELDNALEKYFANCRAQLENQREAKMAGFQRALLDLERNYYRKRTAEVRERAKFNKRGALRMKRNYSGYLYQNPLM